MVRYKGQKRGSSEKKDVTLGQPLLSGGGGRNFRELLERSEN